MTGSSFFNKRRVINIVSMAAVFVMLLIMTILCPLLSDDYHFHYVFQSIGMNPVENRLDTFEEVLTSTKNYYNFSGGRVLSHFMLFLMFSISDSIYYVLNPLMFTLLGYLAYRIAVKGKDPDKLPVLLPCMYLAMLFMLPRFGDNVLWRAGSVNYLWMSVLLVAALMLIDRLLDKPTLVRAFFTSLAVFVSATTNEVNGGLMIVFIAARLLPDLSEKRLREYRLALLPVSFAVIGTSLLLAAPGNAVRISEDVGAGISGPGRFFVLLGLYFLMYIHKNIWLLPVFIAKIVLVDVKKKGKRFTGVVCANRYFVAGFAGVMALSLESRRFQRATFTGMMIALIGLVAAAATLYLHLCENESFREGRKKLTDRAIAGLMSALVLLAGWNIWLMKGDGERFTKWQEELVAGYESGAKEWWKPEYIMDRDRKSIFMAFDSLETTTHNQHFAGWQMLYLKGINLYREVYEVIDVEYYHLPPPSER